MAQAEEGGEVPTTQHSQQLTVYRQRWGILFTVAFLQMSNAGLFISMAPVAYDAVEYYEVPVDHINWFSLQFLLIPLFFCVIMPYFVDKYGLRAALLAGAGFNAAGGVLRAVATSGVIAEKQSQFVVSIVGQAVAAFAEPFLVFTPTKLSQVWFPEKERTISTTVGALAFSVGILVTQVVTPQIVQESDQIPTLNYVFGGVAIVGLVTGLLFITRSQPPTPPSQSAANTHEEKSVPYLTQMRRTFTCPAYLWLLLAIGGGNGFFIAFSSLSQQILCPLGYDKVFVGITVATMVLMGIVGAALSAVVGARTQAFVPQVKLFFALAGIAIIIASVLYLTPDVPGAIVTTVGLFGFFGMGAYPIGLELAVEATYPVEQTITSTFIFMFGQVSGIVAIVFADVLSGELRPENEERQVCITSFSTDTDIYPRDYTVDMLVQMAVTGLLSSMFTIFFNPAYNRREADRSNQPPAGSLDELEMSGRDQSKLDPEKA